MKLNIGCGNVIIRDSINIDIAPLPGVDVIHDLNIYPWPFSDNQFDEISAINVLEHLQDTIKAMEEIHRISKMDGKVIIRVPYWNCYQSIADPTHKRLFHESTFYFFDHRYNEYKKRPYYTRASFKITKIYYWFPLIPVSKGYCWIKISNFALKILFRILAQYLNNVIWCIELEMRVVK